MRVRPHRSVPPYMIINRCRDVVIHLKQSDWAGHGGQERSVSTFRDSEAVNWADWDDVPPNATNPMPFAWDEPELKHLVRVMASSQRDARPETVRRGKRGVRVHVRPRELAGRQEQDAPARKPCVCARARPTQTDSAIDVNLDEVDANMIIYVQTRSQVRSDTDGRGRSGVFRLLCGARSGVPVGLSPHEPKGLRPLHRPSEQLPTVVILRRASRRWCFRGDLTRVTGSRCPTVRRR
jgi:hypothetical protein